MVVGGSLFSQSITPDRRTSWTSHFFTIQVDTTINVLDYGADNTGGTNCSPIFNQILSDFPTQKINVYFPAGTYLFNNILNLRSQMIVSGAGVDSTFLKYNGNGVNNFMQISGALVGSEIALSSHYAKDDLYVIASDASTVQSGDYIKIIEDDAGRITSAWSTNLLGQIVEVDTVIGNEIHFSDPLRMNFDSINHPRFTEINMKSNVGVECLSIERVDATVAQTKNIDFNYASYCYVNGVNSYKTNFGHVVISNGYNVHVTNSHFKDAHAYGDGGQGYGVVLQITSGNCLVQNNIFEHLRHSMLLQACVNGNILGYNYSRDPYWSTFPNNIAGDIVLHGNYSYMNLIEGNTVQNIVIDDSHGLNGPYNTFYRNRAELYGINMNQPSDGQNFVGNEITHSILGFFVLSGSNHYQYGNNDGGTTVPSGTDLMVDTSLYLQPGNPYHQLMNDLPLIGYPNTMNQYKILAQENYEANILSNCNQTFIPDTTSTLQVDNQNPEDVYVYPNPVSSFLFVNGIHEQDYFELYDITGSLIRKGICSGGIDVSLLCSGVYLLKLKNIHTRFVKT